MQGTERSPIPTAVMATVASVGTSRALGLVHGWRAGLREFAIIAASVLTALVGSNSTPPMTAVPSALARPSTFAEEPSVSVPCTFTSRPSPI